MKNWTVVKIIGIIVVLLGVVAFAMGYFVTENLKEVAVGNLFVAVGLFTYVLAKINELKG